MKNRETRHAVSGLFSFLLLAMMLVMMLLVVALGVNVYHRVTTTTENVNRLRTPLYYVAGMIRAMDEEDKITLEDRAGVNALVLAREVDGARYETLIYSYDGALREWFAAADVNFRPENGQSLVQADDFSLCQAEGGAWRMSLTLAGQSFAMTIAPRSGR